MNENVSGNRIGQSLAIGRQSKCSVKFYRKRQRFDDGPLPINHHKLRLLGRPAPDVIIPEVSGGTTQVFLGG